MEVLKLITITSEMVHRFAQVTGDFNPIHLDKKYASQTKFGRPIVHGMLLGSFISKVIATDYPGEGSIYINQTLDFKHPCYIGDEVKVVIKLLDKVGDRYKLKTTVYKHDTPTVLVDGIATVLKK